MYKMQGDVTVMGDIALVTQQAWIQNTTLRGNITYGTPYHQAAYDETIRICELTPDLGNLTQQ